MRVRVRTQTEYKLVDFMQLAEYTHSHRDNTFALIVLLDIIDNNFVTIDFRV